MRFQDLLMEHKVHFETEGRYSRSGWVQFHCPFCSGGKDPHKLYCGYNISYGYVNCWRCGKHRVGETLQLLTGISYGELKEVISQLESVKFRHDPRIVRGKLVLPKGIKPMGKCHRQYLQDRKFDPNEIATLWDVQGIGLASRFAWRLFIPVFYRGELVSWTTRICSEERKDRYISAAQDEEIYNHKTLLYGEDYCRHTIIVTEGPTDVWRIGPGAVACLGQVIKRSQVRRMAKYPVRVICFDNEPEAQERARILCDMLEVFDGDTYNVQLDAADPGSANKQEIRKLREAFNLGIGV